MDGWMDQWKACIEEQMEGEKDEQRMRGKNGWRVKRIDEWISA